MTGTKKNKCYKQWTEMSEDTEAFSWYYAKYHKTMIRRCSKKQKNLDLGNSRKVTISFIFIIRLQTAPISTSLSCFANRNSFIISLNRLLFVLLMFSHDIFEIRQRESRIECNLSKTSTSKCHTDKISTIHCHRRRWNNSLAKRK